MMIFLAYYCLLQAYAASGRAVRTYCIWCSAEQTVLLLIITEGGVAGHRNLKFVKFVKFQAKLWDLLFLAWTRSTQRAQTSLAEADHYSHIVHCKNVEPWLWKTTHPPKKKKKKKEKGSGSLPSPRSGHATTITVFFCSFTHLTIPRSPPKFNQFLLVLLRTRP